MCEKAFYVPVLTALTLALFVLLLRFLPELAAWPEWVTCRGDACSVQGWLGSLSGWAAAIAAGGSVWIVRRQIIASSRQHAELVRLQLQPTIALSERIGETARRFKPITNNVRAYLHSEPQTDTDRENAFNGGMRELSKANAILSSPDFETFETEVGSGMPHRLNDVRNELVKLADFGKGPIRTDVLHKEFDGRRERIVRAIEKADAYCDGCAEAAKNYLDRWGKLIG